MVSVTRNLGDIKIVSNSKYDHGQKQQVLVHGHISHIFLQDIKIVTAGTTLLMNWVESQIINISRDSTAVGERHIYVVP